MPSQKSETFFLAEVDFVTLLLQLLARPNPTAWGKLVVPARLERLFFLQLLTSLPPLLFPLLIFVGRVCVYSGMHLYPGSDSLWEPSFLSDPSSFETNSTHDRGCSASEEGGEGADGIEPKESNWKLLHQRILLLLLLLLGESRRLLHWGGEGGGGGGRRRAIQVLQIPLILFCLHTWRVRRCRYHTERAASALGLLRRGGWGYTLDGGKLNKNIRAFLVLDDFYIFWRHVSLEAHICRRKGLIVPHFFKISSKIKMNK